MFLSLVIWKNINSNNSVRKTFPEKLGIKKACAQAKSLELNNLWVLMIQYETFEKVNKFPLRCEHIRTFIEGFLKYQILMTWSAVSLQWEYLQFHKILKNKHEMAEVNNFFVQTIEAILKALWKFQTSRNCFYHSYRYLKISNCPSERNYCNNL